MAAAPTAVASGRERGLDARRAAQAAQAYFQTLFGNLTPTSLEEVELSPNGRHWLVTLSYEEMRRKAPEIPLFLRIPRQKFKVFKVDRKSGRVVSMKMRNGA